MGTVAELVGGLGDANSIIAADSAEQAEGCVRVCGESGV